MKFFNKTFFLLSIIIFIGCASRSPISSRYISKSKNIQHLINWIEWESSEKYLSPQKSKRIVFTASSAQVRQKINSNSSGYWKKYEDLLKPFSELFLRYN